MSRTTTSSLSCGGLLRQGTTSTNHVDEKEARGDKKRRGNKGGKGCKIFRKGQRKAQNDIGNCLLSNCRTQKHGEWELTHQIRIVGAFYSSRSVHQFEKATSVPLELPKGGAGGERPARQFRIHKSVHKVLLSLKTTTVNENEIGSRRLSCAEGKRRFGPTTTSVHGMHDAGDEDKNACAWVHHHHSTAGRSTVVLNARMARCAFHMLKAAIEGSCF